MVNAAGAPRAPATVRALVERAWDEQHAQPHDSHKWALEGLELARAEGDAVAMAWARLSIGYYQLRYGAREDARSALEAAHEGFSGLSEPRGRVLATNGLARVRMLEGDPAGALETFQRNLAEGSAALTTLDRFYTLNGTAGCFSALGDTPRALGYLFEALGELRDINARPQLATLLVNLGSELVAVGDYEEAHRVLTECQALAAEMRHPRLRLNVLVSLCECLLQLGRDADALACARDIMADSESPLVSSLEGSLFPTAAHAFLRNGELDQAGNAIALALEAARHHGSKFGALHALLMRGIHEAKSGDDAGAIATLVDARGRLEESTPHLVRCQVLEQLAERLAAAGRHAEAYATQREFFAAYERRLGLASRARYFAVQIRFELDRMRAERDALREQALRDPLTGLYNRRYLDSVLGDLLAVYRRSGKPLSVAMIDLDRFKEVNDRCGHPVGDEVLRALARVLRAGTRAGDIACRYGGEEFCLVFPDADAAAAATRVEALLAALVKERVVHAGGELSGLTFSAGVSAYPGHGETRDALVGAADRALYDAKRAGRARVLT